MAQAEERATGVLAGAVNLFRDLKGAGLDRQLNVPIAVMIPIIAAMLADGWTAPEELQEIHAICGSSPIFHRNSRAENEHLIARATRILEDEGLESALRRVVSVLSPALRETAFVHAVRVIFSDGHVGRLETQVIDQMIDRLQIDRERARMLIEAVSIMQHPETA